MMCESCPSEVANRPHRRSIVELERREWRFALCLSTTSGTGIGLFVGQGVWDAARVDRLHQQKSDHDRHDEDRTEDGYQRYGGPLTHRSRPIAVRRDGMKLALWEGWVRRPVAESGVVKRQYFRVG